MIKVGQKVKGFQFDDSSGVIYNTHMDNFIGEVGTVVEVNRNNFHIYFGEQMVESYRYPTKEYLAILREERLKEIGIC
jgi:hypothetical protein